MIGLLGFRIWVTRMTRCSGSCVVCTRLTESRNEVREMSPGRFCNPDAFHVHQNWPHEALVLLICVRWPCDDRMGFLSRPCDCWPRLYSQLAQIARDENSRDELEIRRETVALDHFDMKPRTGSSYHRVGPQHGCLHSRKSCVSKDATRQRDRSAAGPPK